MTAQIRHPHTYLNPPSRSSSTNGKKMLSIYFGTGAMSTLCRYQRLIVRPENYRVDAVRWLQARGVQVLARLNIGADQSGAGEWVTDHSQAAEHSPVDVRHPEWRARIEAQVLGEKAIFNGFYLDNIDHITDPIQIRATLKLIRQVRQWAGPCYLMCNRGFKLLPRLGGCINGVLIDGLSTTWQDGYRSLDPAELEHTAALVTQGRRLHLDVYGLDYAMTTRARKFALRRAEQLGIPTFISNRALDLPNGLLPRMTTSDTISPSLHQPVSA